MFRISKELSAVMPRVLHLGKAAGKPGEVYYPLQLRETEKSVPGDHEVLEGSAQGGYAEPPRSVRWISDPAGPEDRTKWSITGSTRLYDVGTAQDYVCVHQDEAIPAPKHLSAVEGAALLLVGLTAWRALTTKAAIRPGQNVLITGIGGGVALSALQFSVAMGVNVFVASGSQEKLDRARNLGAQGGTIYKAEEWEAEIRQQLLSSRPFIDTVIDGAGGDIVSKAVRLLKPGGVIV
ncbi:hypothetical protein CEP54_014896 [Fusarium duplospermum]|uniref:Alcohol dehydrogenase-like C-terminal domain-containing protein n=1 Tax=Fusarium duplospermum TaxID=1325734 RepID=A0A428NSW4_9HYPO|nr:hypothetical protein CEP54_014896 [Fusarium duplospermum]